MKQSLGFFPTLREAPKDAEAISHILMTRAGLVRQLAAGLYIYLPLGWRALRKIEQIVREEMDAAGAIEVLMPSMQPDTLWKQSGRWDVMGPELMRLHDRNERSFVLGPTHEEVITHLAANEIRSYRDLPKNLYQIQTKFRDEVRPRFGVVRAREFIMKDAYSFDRDEEGAARSYQAMYDAYSRIFKRCGLSAFAVQADTGVMGGKHSHEFMVPAEIGESEIAASDKGNYVSTRDLVACPPPESEPDRGGVPAVEEAHTPGMGSVEEVAAFLKTTPAEMIKTLIVTVDGQASALLLRGDHTLNEIKATKTLGGPVEMASPEVIEKVTGAPVGFAGPVGLSGVKIWADHAIKSVAGGTTGANKKDYHYRNVALGRDFQVDEWADLRLAEEGDLSPLGDGGTLKLGTGIEVGHVFVLGTKYSEALQAHFNDVDGQKKPMVMGCYGIGVSRTLAAVIECCNDANGIVWPASVAPYHVHLLNLSPKNDEVNQAAEALYARLQEAGLDVLMDDRDERPGVKFKDADLLGLPYRIVVGEKSLKEGNVEFVLRRDGDKLLLPPDACAEKVIEHYRVDMAGLKGI